MSGVPILTAFVIQVLVFALVLVLSSRWPGLGLGWLAVHGVVAAVVTGLVLRRWWWWAIAFAAPWLFSIAMTWKIGGWWWLGLLAATLVVFGGGILTRVPLYLSNPAAWQALTALGGPGMTAIDLGAGFGGPMRALARAWPDGRFVNVESSPFTAVVCAVLALPIRRVRTRWGSLWKVPLGQADLVYAFLSPQPMERLWAKVCAEMRPGALFVSNTFPVPGVSPTQVIPLTGRADARLYLYRIPPRS